jgi:peroxiredoxin Q/BCP
MKYTKYLAVTAMAIATLSVITAVSQADKLKGQSTILHVPNYGSQAVKIEKGQAAPTFSLLDSNGTKVNIADFKGKKNVLLVFYPGDNTPGCTTQLCAIRDDYKGLDKLDIKVFGVNPADAESHNSFIKNHKFPFQLLIDKDKKVAEAYDAIGMLGFINRTVVLINKAGKIVLYERGMPKITPQLVANLIK